MTSFADELRELALTAPKEKDTEDVFNEESNAKLADYEDSYEEVERKRGAEVLTEGRYKGKKISRREMFDEDDGDDFSKLNPNLYEIVDEDDDDDEDEDENDDVEDSEQNEEEDVEEIDEDMASEADFGDEESVDDEDPDDDEDQEHDVEDIEDDDCDISSIMKVNEKFKQLEESVANKNLDGIVNEEIRKGQSISQQMKVWDKLLEYRIQFHKVLSLANQLPPCDVFKQTMKEFLSSPENSRVYKQCLRNIERAFEQLTAIREELVRKYPEMKKSLEGKIANDSGDEDIASGDEEIPSDIASGYSEDDDGQPKRKKTKLDEDDFNEAAEPNGELNGDSKKKKKFLLNETLRNDEEFHEKLLPFRNATIDKWYQRTKLASGKTSKGYTALEQPPVKQIEHILEDQDRLLERTRTKRSQYKIIGVDEPDQKETESGKLIIAEIFDDDDFYHHLLREVIERKTQDISDPFEVSRHWIEIQKLRTKIKRKIDTKASKGRRIRFDVISKLVSFMTPHDGSTFSDQAKDELFSSIFGKRVQTVAKSDSRPQLTKSDLEGFRLFK